MRPLSVALSALLLAAAPLAAQQPAPYPTSWDPTLLARADVKSAMAMLEKNFPQQLEEWVRLTEMPGKSGQEQARGAYVKAAFEKEGLKPTVDSIGNVVAVRKGTGGGPTIVIMAHMDVVFPNDTPRKVRRSGDTLFAPGVGDNTASVANMLATLRTMNATRFASKGDIIFIGTTQEELGLKGAEYWLRTNPRPDLLIVPDGAFGSVAYGALGIYWTKYVFTGPGAHTLASRGRPTPVRAVAAAIDRLYQLQFPALPDGAVMNIGQIHGGNIFNAVPQELYFTVDLRSSDPVLLDSLDRTITRVTQEVATEYKVGLRVEIEQKNQAGGTEKQLAGARAHPLVQTAVDINRALGISTGMPGAMEAVATGATDANPGVVRKIPSIAIGGSKANGAHQLTEYALASTALPSTKLLYLLTATFADGVKVVPPAKIVP
ncbi:MAG: M20 family metallopeptidase [Gemmatimonas sp.]|jgi:tripeptide aminopeptidase|uniref:M20 family metallopeptidase n=1 Tax=Gemmatimonas sp. TaxID=1962908 RepID=UPI0022C7AF2F|nr:M20/M25/M40 family metallo-hydrolase [Gemmatimonas sp.]MCA2984292.1 M20/M25/M40 family metallo-hydrolase [Gemmatimonas sp.]MCA2986412.1 M20/M25/M40 family metallo-hydrolase [Gemmatimonas sp.]MCA2995041.1 M20/M25/M40 family metallo-hydrolase [Gemmatimonas sp.]MCE2954895.1 M20/M25/M40 family metallo-hydrolase [Gemmatimonas sp.]MCZ8011034.1 M20/M25/M40 family metallo-hydrolase [Gemmatimonas sp.]